MPAPVINEDLISLSRPYNKRDPLDGGRAVNFRGNTQFSNGYCYFLGYCLNEDAPGTHQGWTETYFGAVAMKEIILSNRYCMAR